MIYKSTALLGAINENMSKRVSLTWECQSCFGDKHQKLFRDQSLQLPKVQHNVKNKPLKRQKSNDFASRLNESLLNSDVVSVATGNMNTLEPGRSQQYLQTLHIRWEWASQSGRLYYGHGLCYVSSKGEIQACLTLMDGSTMMHCSLSQSGKISMQV